MVSDITNLRFNMWQVRYYLHLFVCVVSLSSFRDLLRELCLLATPVYWWKSYGIRKLENLPEDIYPMSGGARRDLSPDGWYLCQVLHTMVCGCFPTSVLAQEPFPFLLTATTNPGLFSGKSALTVWPQAPWVPAYACVSTFTPCAAVPTWTAGFH